MFKALNQIRDEGMTRNQTSNAVFIAALGMMATLLSVEFLKIATWHEIMTPSFFGTLLAHIGTVAGAYVAGRLVPEDRKGKSTRRRDPHKTDK